MAKAKTFDVEKNSGYPSRRKCAICGEESKYRVFWNPTYMNGDAMYLGDFCEEHKNVDKEKLRQGEIETQSL